jgi:hypothetical protein
MDPVTLIVTALVAGAAAGLKDAAGSAVKDAYTGLKGLLTRKFADRSVAQTVLDEHEQQPDVYEAPLRSELAAAGVDQDAQILQAAHRLLELADPQGAASGKYEVNIRTGQGVQIGDHNQQHNVFGAPPSENDRPIP